MARKPLTQEQAIETYTELQRRVQVGAYLELEHDGSFPPDDGTPESTTLESLHNLEAWAEKQGKEFCWNHDDNTWSLEPLHPPEIAPEHEAMNRWLASQVEEQEPLLSRCPYCGQMHQAELIEQCPLKPT